MFLLWASRACIFYLITVQIFFVDVEIYFVANYQLTNLYTYQEETKTLAFVSKVSV